LHGAAEAEVFGDLAVREFFEELGVHRRVAEHDDVAMVFRRRAQHGRAADVDLFDGFGEGDAFFGDRRLERIEVYDDEIDARDDEALDVGEVVGVVAVVENRAEDFRREGLDASAEDLRRAGPLRDRRDFDAGVGQVFGGAAGGEDLHALRFEGAGEVGDTGFVGDGEDGPFNLHSTAGCRHA
jgi:hypothetical protein